MSTDHAALLSFVEAFVKAPKLTHACVDGHENDGGGSGDLLADPEEEGEDGEAADVHPAARH